jgi:hypothetical protein
MPRLLSFLIAAIVIAASTSNAAPDDADDSRLPLGLWRIEFSNGVVESCDIGREGTAVLIEPARRSSGHAVVEGKSVMIRFDDDRIERWTPVGKRYVVEHWFPASRFPPAEPVLGIAERKE